MISTSFDLRELVPKILYDYMGDKSIWFLDPRLITLVQFFRDHYGLPITINDWHTGGTLIDCGFRMPDSKTGATLSQHKFGRAVDCHFSGITDYEEMRNKVRNDWYILKAQGLTTIELATPTWLHIDIRHTGMDGLLEVPYR